MGVTGVNYWSEKHDVMMKAFKHSCLIADRRLTQNYLKRTTDKHLCINSMTASYSCQWEKHKVKAWMSQSMSYFTPKSSERNFIFVWKMKLIWGPFFFLLLHCYIISICYNATTTKKVWRMYLSNDRPKLIHSIVFNSIMFFK